MIKGQDAGNFPPKSLGSKDLGWSVEGARVGLGVLS